MDYSVENFIQCLQDHKTATLALNHWCTGRKLPGAHALQAQVLQDIVVDPQSYDGPLSLEPGEILRHRRVCLNWGSTTVSEADNWYLPERLPPAMREQLALTTVPFGQVVLALGPVRTRTLQAKATGAGQDPRFILHVNAVLHTADGTPIAEVREHYRRELVDPIRNCAY